MLLVDPSLRNATWRVGSCSCITAGLGRRGYSRTATRPGVAPAVTITLVFLLDPHSTRLAPTRTAAFQIIAT